LLAWFLAGFSLRQLWEIAAPIVLAGGYWVSIPAAACFVWLTGRLINRRDDARHAKLPRDYP
jgi:hypothetical protein